MMKRRCALISLLFFFLVHYATADTLVFNYYPGKYSLKAIDKYTLINFDKAFLSNRAGEPTFPYLQGTLLLPPGNEAVSVEFSGYVLTPIPGDHLLYPCQHSRPLNDSIHVNEPELLVNKDLYRCNKNYPVSQTGPLTTQYYCGYPLAVFTYTPVIFNPVQKRLSYYQSVSIRVITQKSTDRANISPDLSARTIDKLKKLVYNPQMSLLYPPLTSDTSDYQILIISPGIFSDHLSSLIDHYFCRGMKSKIMITDTIYGEYTGIDNQEKIRNCIIQEYQDNHIKHLLLCGDVEMVPARGFYAQVQSSSLYTDDNIPSDLYYAALDGNWNTDGDNLWAEPGEDDLYPELSVGRFPVNTLTELENIINKTIHYQNIPVPSECRKPLLVGEKLYDNPLTWGGNYMDLLIGLHSDNGYNTQGIPSWHNIQKLYDRDLPAPWTLSDLMTNINSGTSFLHHTGHSNAQYLMRMTSSFVTNSNFNMVNGIDHNYIPVYTHGCYCAAFDYSDCIAEKMLNIQNFAVAFVGNSRYGWFNEGTTEGPSIHLHREFVDALYHEGIGQIGSAHTFSKIRTAPWVNAPGQWEEGALRWCFYDCNVLGDPAMFIWTDTPMNLSLTHEDTISLNTALLTVNCDTGNYPVQNLTCLLLKDTVVIASAITDSSGMAQLPMALNLADTGIITLIVSGYNCLTDTSSILVLPPASISGHILYDNNANTPLDSVIVYLIEQGDTLAQEYADSNGHFRFNYVDEGDYSIKTSCSGAWGGCNSSDALMVMRHFVHISLLSGLPLEASDIDNNQMTNTLDAFAIQRRFVGFLAGFPAGDWVFEKKSFHVGAFGETVVNIFGLCKGDVNKSFIPY